MGNFFKSLFSSGGAESPEEEQQKTDQKNFDILKYDGIRALRINQAPYAIKCFIEALKLKEDSEVLAQLINAYASRHETEEALEIAQRLVVLEPENLAALLTRASIYHQLEREDEALADCMSLLETDASNPAIHLLLGRIKKALKDWSGAETDLTQAITLKGDLADAYLLRAEVLLEQNKLEEARQDIDVLIELAPEEEATYLLSGRIYEKASDMEAATTEYNKVFEMNPFNEEAVILITHLLVNNGQLDEALTLLDEELEINSDFIAAYTERAKIKRLKGDIEGAVEDEQQATELQPEAEDNPKVAPPAEVVPGLL
ncbi:hypothetical protein FACS189416_4000 [Bacteroidia bacterium]|nr:hypothetical protein FACS189416_4000 [Bacteroidia bacterium]